MSSEAVIELVTAARGFIQQQCRIIVSERRSGEGSTVSQGKWTSGLLKLKNEYSFERGMGMGYHGVL